MSESQVPPPPPASPPAGKKRNPWVWVIGGCLALILLVVLLMGACTWFVAEKAQELAQEIEADPVKVVAETVVWANPDLELVATDDEAGKMTVRHTPSGKEVTLDFQEIAEGTFSFETEEGRSTLSFDPEGEGGLTFEGPEGRTAFGGSADDDLPAWISVYPGASEAQGAYSSTAGNERSGAVTFRSTDPVARVLEFYESRLKAAGLDVTKEIFTTRDAEGGALTGTSPQPQRSVRVGVQDESGETVISITYSEPAAG